ncbi:MAG TPA: tRNA (adenosine(37)-N6)-threonylcarbamoyltransferase complex ATPase subunit type 1 TsaE [Candidatus Binatia bacterium]|nr:tRNA (adenosine(37)-N6)-threonylcarbamoyltransferase complex ATPase subunit type 1 TsaE [Candidatus Binatia bacterium]
MKYRNVKLSGLKQIAKEVWKQTGPDNRIIGLVGTLGSGKTTFTRALAQIALGITNAKSPTFTIIHCYNGRGKSFYHIDLYRLEKVRELDTLGLDELLAEKDSIVLIEWADKFPKLLKTCDTIIEFEVLKNNLRNVTVTHN